MAHTHRPTSRLLPDVNSKIARNNVHVAYHQHLLLAWFHPWVRVEA